MTERDSHRRKALSRAVFGTIRHTSSARRKEARRDEVVRNGSAPIYVSAVDGTGLDHLLQHIDAMIEEDRVSRVRLRIPQKEGKALALLEAAARIYSRTYQDGAVCLEAEAPASVVRRVREWLVG